MEWFENWALPLTVFLPLVGALILVLIPREEESAIKGVGLATAALTFLVSVGVIAGFDFSDRGYNTYQFEIDLPWIGAINSNFHLGVDGISLPLLVLSTFLVLLCVIYSWNHWDEPRNPKAFLILMLITYVPSISLWLPKLVFG